MTNREQRARAAVDAAFERIMDRFSADKTLNLTGANWRDQRIGDPELAEFREKIMVPIAEEAFAADAERSAQSEPGEMAAFGASDAACYLYPGEDQAAERAAYCAGAADATRSIETEVRATIARAIDMIASAMRGAADELRPESGEAADAIVGIAESLEERREIMVRDVSAAAPTPAPQSAPAIPAGMEPTAERFKEVAELHAIAAPASHVLKVWPPYFEDIRAGRKPFEVRKDDRSYAVGDILDLVEFDPNDGAELGLHHTGRNVFKRVTYILRGGQFGLEPGYVVMALEDYPPKQPSAPASDGLREAVARIVDPEPWADYLRYHISGVARRKTSLDKADAILSLTSAPQRDELVEALRSPDAFVIGPNGRGGSKITLDFEDADAAHKAFAVLSDAHNSSLSQPSAPSQGEEQRP